MVKYGFPLASSIALLAWGMLEFPKVRLTDQGAGRAQPQLPCW